ncbi:adenylate/guanylate cyclase domain-containing protein [Lewinellaceae bacterium SD302]|nr:adenylate/guanylate cyclase domain-containing protein [Lewinellaceae bacterium SD302]
MQHLIPAYIQERLLAGDTHGSYQAFALNVDLSGFTRLTEDLMREGTEGAEKMSVILNEIFEPLVALVYRRGGFIPYFAGDAFTAVFQLPADQMHAMHLLSTAAEARHIFRDNDKRFGGQYTIGLKAGLAYGTVEYGIVGSELKAFYFRGEAIDRSADCQSSASDQDIVIDELTATMLDGRPITLEEISPRVFRVVGRISGDAAKVAPTKVQPTTSEVAAQFLPETLIRQQQSGEFRSVISVFLGFRNISNQEEMSAFAEIVLRESLNFGGYFKEIDFGDKGGLMTIFFGAPVSFENSVIRALEFGATLQATFAELNNQYPQIQYRIGMTMGTAFTGIVGGEERCQYACVGNRVNLAARIMTNADWQELKVDAELANCPLFRFMPKGKTKYKGISQPVATFSLEGRQQGSGKPDYSGPMIAREKETKDLVEFIDQSIRKKQPGIAYVYGEAGIGKSRLTHELQRKLAERHELGWHLCPCDQILRKSFNPFIYFLRHYFGQSPERNARQNRQNFDDKIDRLIDRLAHFQSPQISNILKELKRTTPILAGLLGLRSTESSIWEQLDARGRYQNTISAITNLFLAEAQDRPLVIELEDIHWIDDDSRALVRQLNRKIRQRPIVLLCTARYFDDGGKIELLKEEQIKQTRIRKLSVELGGLSPQDIEMFAERSLGGSIHQEFLEVLQRSANSNPFYVEQLLEYFQENNLLIQDEGQWNLRDKSIKLSNSINTILTARIDRLSDMVRDTVKAAAVIGREFDISVLTEVMAGETSPGADREKSHQLLRDQIAQAEKGQIWSAMNELRYIFRHSLMREAAYNMQLNTRLQKLHAQIAEAIGRLYRESIEERYVDLAFHYEQAGNDDRTIEYLLKAADYAADNYQNQQALEFYDRLLNKLEAEESDTITRIYLRKGKVQEIIGDWEDAQQTFERARKTAKQSRDIILLGKANDHLGNLLTLRGRYDEAMQYLQVAASLFESIDDVLGIAKVYSHLGNLFFRRAKYDEAESYYRRSLDSGFNQMGTAGSAQTVSFLGLTYMNRGQYEEGIKLIEEQIPLHQKNNDTLGLAGLHTNLGIVYFESGDYDAAKKNYETGLQLAEQLSNKQLLAIGTGCLGTVLQKQGQYDEAMEMLIVDLEICEELGDWQGISIAEGLLGELYSIMGQFDKAIPHLDRSLTISKDLGYRKGVAKAINTLGDLYYWQEEFEKSLEYYNEAIAIAKESDNRLVLGSSTMEKGLVLLNLTERREELKTTIDQAVSIAKELGNPDLLVDVRLLQALGLQKDGQTKAAKDVLFELLATLEISAEQQAAARYELFLIDPEDINSRNEARALYEQLYRETPKYQYELRLERLRKE